MRTRAPIPALLILVFFLILFFQPLPAGAQEPTARVRSMLDEVLAIQNNPALQGNGQREERREGIKKVIARDFDFSIMARNALGNTWSRLNSSQRKEFTGIFQDLFQDSYTKLVLDFLKREKVAYGRETGKNGTAEVDTTILRPSEKIPVNYLLTQAGGQWLVTDVVIDGVSIVRNYQRTFARIVQTESYKSLLGKLRLQQQAIVKSSGPEERSKARDSSSTPDNREETKK